MEIARLVSRCLIFFLFLFDQFDNVVLELGDLGLVVCSNIVDLLADLLKVVDPICFLLFELRT